MSENKTRIAGNDERIILGDFVVELGIFGSSLRVTGPAGELLMSPGAKPNQSTTLIVRNAEGMTIFAGWFDAEGEVLEEVE